MRVFISWSGPLSHAFAEALKDLLTKLFSSIKPFLSSRMEKGVRSTNVLANELAESDFGILCLTKSNLATPWILFEAGALSKLSTGRVVPLLLNLPRYDFEREGGPLTQFQSAEFERNEIWGLIKSIHEKLPDQQRSLVQLEQLFDSQFPTLVAAFNTAKNGSPIAEPEPQSMEQNVAKTLDVVLEQYKLLTDVITDPAATLPEGLIRRLFARVEPEIQPLDHTFLSRTEKHQNIVYSVRDICVKAMPNGIRYRPPRVRKKEAARPHPMLERIDPDIVQLLGHIARMFDLLAPPNTRVWASLRDLRGDNQYHTFRRGGEFNANRGTSSSALSEESKVVLRLKDSAALGTVVITGSGAGPEEWEPQRNDKYGEDLSVMMGLVCVKSFTKKGHWRIAGWPWILAVNANRKGVFTEQHIPLMQCCVETLSLLANTLLRHSDADEEDD